VLAHLHETGRLSPEQYGRCMDFIAAVRF
jgi:hypothetical protein